MFADVAMEDLEQLVPSTSKEDSDDDETNYVAPAIPPLPTQQQGINNIMEQSWCSVRQRVVGAQPRNTINHEINQNIATQYESLDYDICENTLLRKEEGTKGYKFLIKKRFARWVVFLFIGIVTAMIACCIDIAIEELSSIKFYYLKYYVDLCMNERCMYLPHLYWVLTNIFPVLIGTLLVTYVEPVAAGSGIPQVKCYLNGVKVPRIVRIKTLIVKSVGVTCSVLGGLAVGKEGPMIHSGAVVAAGISQGKTTSLAKDFHFFNYFREDHEKRDFVSGGAAAGVAAAFGAPMGGVLFSLEEGSSFWNQSLTWRIFFASMISTFTLNVILSAYHGFPGQLTYSGLLNFGAFPNISYEFFEIPLFVLMGALGGVLGALFNFVNLKLTLFRMKYITKRWLKVLEVLVVSSVSATVAFAMIMLIDDCRPLGQDPTKYPVQLYCGDGEYSAVASIWFQNPEASVRSLFHDPPGSHNPWTVGVFFLIYFSLSCWTYGLSVSSGLFIPSLLTGAAWGRLAGMVLEFIFPNAVWTNPGKYALIGAASQLGGNVRMTISLTVILIEATANITFGLPLMITLITAKWVGDLFNEGIYDMHIHLSGVPILGWDPPPLSHNVFASDFMSNPVVRLNCVESVARIVDILRREIHSGFPVVTSVYSLEQVDPGNRLCGLILRSQLIVLLQNKIFVETKDEWMRKSISLKLFRDAYPRYPKIEQIHISDQERSYTLDLRTFMNPAPYTVPLAASLPRVFKLFRGLGLRHLPVIDDQFELVGIVTRKDLARFGTGH